MGELLVRSQLALGMLQTEFAAFLGVSTRTMRRWVDGSVHLLPSTVVTLAGAVHAKDPDLAGRVAGAHGYTLEELGIGLAPDELIAHAIVSAAAEVAEVSPRTMRAALAVAFERTRAAGLTLEAAHALVAKPMEGFR